MGTVAHRLKVEGVDFNAQGSNVSLFEFTSKMALYEGGLFSTEKSYVSKVIHVDYSFSFLISRLGPKKTFVG